MGEERECKVGEEECEEKEGEKREGGWVRKRVRRGSVRVGEERECKGG